MRLVLATLLLAHGLLHALGFLRAWGIAVLPPLDGPAVIPSGDGAARVVGAVWLLTGLLLVAAAALRVSGAPGWWRPGAAGVVLSQGLVVLQWQDAKAGTAVNVVLAVAVLSAVATARFHRRVDGEARAMLAGAPRSPPSRVRPQELAGLPTPVARWLQACGVVGRPRAVTVRLRQRGRMHTSKAAPWMPALAQQYVTVDPPQFLWVVEATMASVVPLVGRDRYVHGRGEMWITVGGLVNVAAERGPKIDQGAMMRYLAEIVIYPSAALEPYLRWEAIDDDHARAIMTSDGACLAAVFQFDAKGRVTEVVGERFSSATGALETWRVQIVDWTTFDGVEVGSRGDVVWALKDGDFVFYRWAIVELEWNVPALYRAK